LTLASQCLQDHLAKDLVVIEVGPQTVIADHFLIATATSGTHLAALADALSEQLKGFVHHQEGDRHSSWILLDCGDVVIHLFLEEARSFYALERLWGDLAMWKVEDTSAEAVKTLP
jgi:ribosome-associated protein